MTKAATTWPGSNRAAWSTQALYAVVMEAYTGGISTRKVDSLVEQVGEASSISKSEVSHICQGLDQQMKAVLSLPLGHPRIPYV